VRWLLGGLLVLGMGCSQVQWASQFARPSTAPASRSERNIYLQLHLYDGSLLVCQDWEIRPASRTIACAGNAYDEMRNPRGNAYGTRAYDDVALVELTRPTASTDPGYAILGVVTGLSGLATTICLVTAGACFGD
jgi:hypothetical protein